MSAVQQYERITAGDVKVGDRVARARNHPFHEVTDVQPTAVAVWLTFEGIGRQRPMRTVLLWREVVA